MCVLPVHISVHQMPSDSEVFVVALALGHTLVLNTQAMWNALCTPSCWTHQRPHSLNDLSPDSRLPCARACRGFLLCFVSVYINFSVLTET